MSDNDFDPATMTPEEAQAFLADIVKVAMQSEGMAPRIFAAAALVHMHHMQTQHTKFNPDVGSEVPIDAETLSLTRAAGCKVEYNQMGALPYTGCPQVGSNVICFYKDEAGQIHVLVGKRGNQWLTPQGMRKSLTRTINNPANEHVDNDPKDAAVRLLLAQTGINASDGDAEVFVAMSLPRDYNPGGNAMSFVPTAVGVVFSDMPEMGERTDMRFERLEWVPLSHFRGDGDQGKTFLLSDGQETGEMPDLPEGLPYEYIISEVMKKHLDRECLAAVNMDAEGVAKRFTDFPERPEYMTGKQGQAYINATFRGIEILSAELDRLPKHTLSGPA